MNEHRSWGLPPLACLGVLALGVLVIPGCGVSSANTNIAEVWGKVTYAGKPLTNGVIVFVPMDQFHTNWGVGQINHEGMYRLSTHIPQLAMKAGSYRVCIRPQPPTLAEVNGSPKERREAEKAREAEGGVTEVVTVARTEIPERFLDPTTSGMVVPISPSTNRIDIDLTN